MVEAGSSFCLAFVLARFERQIADFAVDDLGAGIIESLS